MNKAKPLTEEQRQRIKSELHRRALLALEAERQREVSLLMAKVTAVLKNFEVLGFNTITIEDLESATGELSPAQLSRLKVLLVAAGARLVGREAFIFDRPIDFSKLDKA
jgi:hypothetical protein